MDTLNPETSKAYQAVSGVNDQLSLSPPFSSNIQAVAECNPRLVPNLQVSANISGSSMPAVVGRRYVVYAVMLSQCKDNTHTGTNLQVAGTQTGKTAVLARLQSITLTADNRTLFVPYPYPLVMDPNTSIVASNNGSYSSASVYVYYTLEYA